MLVKPQFELQPGQVGKGGIVKDVSLFAVVEQRLREACTQLGLQVQAWLESPIEGGDGNREFFIHALRVGDAPDRAQTETFSIRPASRRMPRSRRHSPDEQARQDAHEGQPGPARRKRKS
jgi:23S rRNA (cytidine1920-2'-O)/16S rRNA (cytidine1409-2'-O)-methyltransferase